MSAEGWGQCDIERTISGPAVVCAASSGIVYVTEPGMTNYDWTISSGGTITVQGTNSITVTWDLAGSETISVNYLDSDDCTADNPTVYYVEVVNAPVTPTLHSQRMFQNS